MYLDNIRKTSSDDILFDLIGKLAQWNKLIEFCKENRVFKINNKECYIYELKMPYITFRELETDKEIKKFFNELKNVKITEYVFEYII
jgi:ribosome-associated toxin RatA of RatAB toxin-antitoxin module